MPGFFFTLSAMTYPAFLVFGVRLEYMGISPIVADFFGALGLAAVGLGLWGTSRLSGSGGFGDWLSASALGVAAR